MQLKRRQLIKGNKVLLIFIVDIGFVQEEAIFIGYRSIMVGEVHHQIPIFECGDKDISGLDCFWAFPEEVSTPENLEWTQRELIDVQIIAAQLAKELGYTIPTKIKDYKMDELVSENVDRLQHTIKKLGYDPRDETWINEMAANSKESKWFKFEHDNALIFTARWDEIVDTFNKQHQENISTEDAKMFSKKRMRYLLGAYNTRMSGNPNKSDWKKSALEFEKHHHDRENRMLTWSLLHQHALPMVKVKKDLLFWFGPYFNECIERIPQLFTNHTCRYIKPGVILRVVSYDPQMKYIRLDFTKDVRQMIKPSEQDVQPWVKDYADYEIVLHPNEIETHLEILEPLT